MLQPTRAASLALLATAFGLTLALTACRSYHAGRIGHPQIKSICIGEFDNVTDEPALAILLRSKLAEAFARDGTFKLADRASADVVVQGRVVGYTSRGIASAKLRDDAAKPDERSSYKTTHYRIDLTVEYELAAARQEGHVVLRPATLTGEGSFPELPDMNTGRQTGFEQAAADVAAKIAAAVSEAW